MQKVQTLQNAECSMQNESQSFGLYSSFCIHHSAFGIRRRGQNHAPFIIACVVIALAAITLTTATATLKLHFQKQSVPIARPLTMIDSHLGPWVQVSKDEPLEADIEQTLGTKQYIFRWYVDSRQVPQDVIDKFTDMDANRQQGMARELAVEKPGSAVQLAVTYYTGMVDTVAHIPDRCYVADGYEPSAYDTVNWVTGPGRNTEARYIHFEDQTGQRASQPMNVAYFFRVNDIYTSSPLDVRWTLQDLKQKYGFYAKVELMTIMGDHAKSASVMTDFLTYAMPEIEKSWPDWTKVNAH
jgi:hypothetical protein